MPKETIEISITLAKLSLEKRDYVHFFIHVDGVGVGPAPLSVSLDAAPAFFRRLRPFKLNPGPLSADQVNMVMFGVKNI